MPLANLKIPYDNKKLISLGRGFDRTEHGYLYWCILVGILMGISGYAFSKDLLIWRFSFLLSVILLLHHL